MITTYPVACPTCNAAAGEPCSTRLGHEAARPHKARLAAPIDLGQHTHDCRAAAATSAAENIAEWDDETKAKNETNPVYWADHYLADGIAECICWPTRRHPLTNQRIRRGWMILAEHDYRTTYTTVRVDQHGNPLTGEPTRQYQATDPGMAATYAAHLVITGPEVWSAAIDSADESLEGGTWTFTPSIGSPVHIRVTTELDAIDQTAHAAAVLADIQRTGEAKRAAIAALFGSTPAETVEPEDTAAETRTCTACGDAVEHLDGIGWVQVAPNGHYDLCPERYIEATDTQRGHTV